MQERHAFKHKVFFVELDSINSEWCKLSFQTTEVCENPSTISEVCIIEIDTDKELQKSNI